MRTAQLLSVVIALSFGAVLAGAPAQTTTAAQSGSVHLSTEASAKVEELWIEPHDLEQRDLFRGPAFGPPPPQLRSSFEFIKEDTSGKSPGYDVRDANGVEWSVKLGPEAQSEVVASRIVWAIGYHQPPTYYLSEWTLTGATEGAGTQQGGRFRPEVPDWKVDSDRWEFHKGPLATTRAMKGLLVALMMINNWDLKDSNNKRYEVTGSGSGPRRMYVVRDLGASLGGNEQSKWIRWLGIRGAQGSKNNLEDFETSGFIDHVENGRVVFEYSGPNKSLVDNISVEDVRWTAELMSRLSHKQWNDVFRAGGYSPDQAARYIAVFKKRIAEGLALK
jgi:hypothetical protein